jgi:hypothetical protein
LFWSDCFSFFFRWAFPRRANGNADESDGDGADDDENSRGTSNYDEGSEEIQSESDENSDNDGGRSSSPPPRIVDEFNTTSANPQRTSVMLARVLLRTLDVVLALPVDEQRPQQGAAAVAADFALEQALEPAWAWFVATLDNLESTVREFPRE